MRSPTLRFVPLDGAATAEPADDKSAAPIGLSLEQLSDPVYR
jgi:hypothetical protein